jgi:hypothetical protein
MEIKQKVIEDIKIEIQNLGVRKKLKINENGNKVKVCRTAENEYAVYFNGNFVTEDKNWEEAFELTIVLLK